jgi:translation elongation factor EF-1alpha
MEWSKVATITHYFGRIGVAAMILEDDLSLGDWIAFGKGDELLFEQEVTSMQIEHQDVEFATRGDAVGMKVDQQVREGIDVYKRIE